MHWIFADISFLHAFQCFHFSFLYLTFFAKGQYCYFLKNNDYIHTYIFLLLLFSIFVIFCVLFLISAEIP